MIRSLSAFVPPICAILPSVTGLPGALPTVRQQAESGDFPLADVRLMTAGVAADQLEAL